MPIEAVVILIVAILAFVAIGIWLAVTATHPILPEGKEYTVTHVTPDGQVEAIVRFVGFTPLGGSGLIRAADLAWRVHCATYVWGITRHGGMALGNAFKAMKTTRILIMGNESFNAYAARASVMDPKGANAFQIWTPQRIGDGPPLLVIRGSLGHKQQGALAVHEALHALAHASNLGHQNIHDDATIWSDIGGPSSIEARALVIANSITLPDVATHG